MHRDGLAVATANIWLENSSVDGGAVASLNTTGSLSLINNSFVANEAYGNGAHLWSETAQVESVLGGEVEPFMEAWLRWTRAQAEAE